MKRKLLIAISSTILSLFSLSAYAAWECNAYNPVKSLHWVWRAHSQSTAYSQVSSRCLSVTANPANCQITCSPVSKYESVTVVTPAVVTPITTVAVGGSYTCVVRDFKGRRWSWSSGNPSYSCNRAIQACNNWHISRGIVNGMCNVIS